MISADADSLFSFLPTWEHNREQIVKNIVSRPGYLKFIIKVRDELHLLTEWLLHHTEIVDHQDIIIFDNRSEDPQLADFYKSLPPDIVVARYDALHNTIHNTDLFPELYEALARSCVYFAFLDCDEYLIHIDENLVANRTVIVDVLKNNYRYDVHPCTWLNNGLCSRDLYECSSSHRLGEMLYSGKPVIRSKAGCSGWLLHNYSIEKKFISGDNLPKFFVQHRLNLFPELRVRATLVKMAAEKLIPPDWSAERTIKHDFSGIKDPGVHRYISELKKLSTTYAPATMESGFVNIKLRKRLEFFSGIERDAFLEFRLPWDYNFVQRYLGI